MRKILIGMAGAAIVLVGAVWFFFLRSDAPPPATLEGAVAAVAGETTTTAGAGATETTIASDVTDAGPVGLDGTWTTDPTLSFVGYRIDEELASIGATTAVGRTSEIDANLTFEGSSVTGLSVSVDMTTLQSDRSQRDNAMGSRGLETSSFPSASFALGAPIALDAVPGDGERFSISAVGDLTLHGVTRSISLDLEGSLVEGTMVVVGSTVIALADFDIDKPTGFSVVGIADTGLLELQLAFVRR